MQETIVEPGGEGGPASFDEAGLTAAALSCGAAGSAMTDAAEVVFRPEFRGMCRDNRCGNFGRNWQCPPDVGEIDELIAGLKTRGRVMVFHFIGRLARAYDWKGMQAAARDFSTLVLDLQKKLGQISPAAKVLGAGPCLLCEKCACLTEEPCRHPERAVSSLEAHGVDVAQLARLTGLKYNNGPETVTYFGAVFV
ncbi:MAG: DUF2284 domain-containing protein [Deltaproteobacteria bacterium]|jgi:predicted metal-binding protein|nr:DUF2284 domain-containing protein [Deltaproteobacteria bacterium]